MCGSMKLHIWSNAIPSPQALACVPGDEECREAGCKKALAHCAAGGLAACVADGVCWQQDVHAHACPKQFVPDEKEIEEVEREGHVSW